MDKPFKIRLGRYRTRAGGVAVVTKRLTGEAFLPYAFRGVSFDGSRHGQGCTWTSNGYYYDDEVLDDLDLVQYLDDRCGEMVSTAPASEDSATYQPQIDFHGKHYVDGPSQSGECGYRGGTLNPWSRMDSRAEAERAAAIANIAHAEGYAKAQRDIRAALGII